MALPSAISAQEFYRKLSKEDRKSIRDLNDQSKINFISTGSWVINTLVGDGTGTYKPGGLPRGHIVEVFGDESCGKTTLGICACRQAQDLGGIAVWLDFERTFHKDYAQKLGLDLNPEKFIFITPDHFEHGTKMIVQALAVRPMIIVVDSVSAMIPKSFLEGAVDEVGRIGLQAQLMSVSLNYLTKHLPEANTCLMFTNQLRSVIKINAWDKGPKEESSGGRALKYYSSVRIQMTKGLVERVTTTSRITGKEDKEPINVQVKVVIVKNKIDKPWFAAPLFIRFGEGFDNIASIIELAINTRALTKTGTFYGLVDDEGKYLFKVQGREQLHTLLQENDKFLKLLSSRIVLQQDTDAKTLGEQEIEEAPLVEEVMDIDALLNNTSETYKNKVSSSKNNTSEDNEDTSEENPPSEEDGGDTSEENPPSEETPPSEENGDTSEENLPKNVKKTPKTKKKNVKHKN
jgi:recombination protein RecA